MKKMLFLAVVATSMFVSCKGGLANEAADKFCNCSAVKDAAALIKSVDGKSEAEKKEAAGKMAALEPQLKTCVGDVEAKVKALKEDEQKKFDTDFKAAVEKKCPDIAKAIGGK